MGIRTLGHIPRPHTRNTVPYRIQFKTNHWLYTPNMESKAGFSLQKHWWWLHRPYPFRPGQQSQYLEGNALLPTLHLPFCSERKPCCGQRFQDWLLSLTKRPKADTHIHPAFTLLQSFLEVSPPLFGSLPSL